MFFSTPQPILSRKMRCVCQMLDSPRGHSLPQVVLIRTVFTRHGHFVLAKGKNRLSRCRHSLTSQYLSLFFLSLGCLFFGITNPSSPLSIAWQLAFDFMIVPARSEQEEKDCHLFVVNFSGNVNGSPESAVNWLGNPDIGILRLAGVGLSALLPNQ